MNKLPIDIVITWVDGNDPVWIKDKNKYSTKNLEENNEIGSKSRYHDNGLLKYLFRGIESFLPFIRNVYFVTYGHLPTWLNTSNKQLIIVNHSDFLPKEYLPTFNSNTLNLNLHRIKGLSNNFIYLNDDCFFLKKSSENLFFKNDLPTDMCVMDILDTKKPTPYWHFVFNDTILFNKNFNKKKIQKKYFKKWFSIKYGKMLFKNILLSPFSLSPGFYETHLPSSYNKDMYIKAWEENFAFLDNASKNKFRTNDDASEYLIKYYQYGTGHFEPINKNKYGHYYGKNYDSICKDILSQKYNYICINEDPTGDNLSKIIKAFEKILPTKSKFEK